MENTQLHTSNKLEQIKRLLNHKRRLVQRKAHQTRYFLKSEQKKKKKLEGTEKKGELLE